MSTVFITQEKMRRNSLGDLVSEFDMTPALKYGQPKILVPAGRALFAPVHTVRTIKEQLEGFSDEDYLLTIGDPSIIAVAAIVASEMNKGRVKLLKWDKQMREYLPIQIDTSGRAV
jgi:hypothetical protein